MANIIPYGTYKIDGVKMIEILPFYILEKLQESENLFRIADREYRKKHNLPCFSEGLPWPEFVRKYGEQYRIPIEE